MAGMKLVVGACAALLAATCAGQAADRIKVDTQNYAISGQTGAELYASMVKRGPRHGLLSRAIAQTSYKNGVCRVVQAKPVLMLTYTYPQPTQGLSPQLKRRWAAFMSGVKRHEQKHGAIAREMVRAAEASVRGLKVSADPTCRQVRSEVKRRADKVYAEYEARQLNFDAREHRDRGNIDRLILSLVKG